MSALKIIGFVILAAILAAAIGAWRWGFPLRAETSDGVGALQKAKVLERLIERTASRPSTRKYSPVTTLKRTRPSSSTPSPVPTTTL